MRHFKKNDSLMALILIFAMLPVFAFAFCPCAQAAPVDAPVYQRTPCHGCCPEMKPVTHDDAVLSPAVQVNAFKQNLQTISGIQESPEQNNSKTVSPDSAGPPVLLTAAAPPVYLLIQTFRI